MVKVVFQSNNINDVFDGDIALAINANKTKATYTDEVTEGSLVFFGSNFAREGDSVFLSAGKVEKLVINDEDGNHAGTLTGANIKAKDLSEAFAENGMTGLLTVLLGGKDEIIGSNDDDQLFGFGKADEINGRKGADTIAGGAGNDTLSGGQDSDTFYFIPSEDGKGKDVITDFDVKGEVTDFLLIEGADIADTDKANHNHDTLLTLSDGSTILLEGVHKADFLAYLETLMT
ncbi:MAG: Hemolysin-type calcium-binding region [Rhizobium sp.]|nr:Hemolysin-type calcium-binding region [Rhizobium sp.]